jgi:hypothetical protein
VDICSKGAITALPGDFREDFLAESAQMRPNSRMRSHYSNRNLPGDEVCLVHGTARTKGRSLNVQALKKNGRQVDGINHGP